MLLRNHPNKHLILLRLGYVFLLAFFVMLHWTLRPQQTFTQDVIDSISGCLLGASIGCMLLSMFFKNRAHPAH